MSSNHREPDTAGPGNEPGFADDDDDGISLLDIVVVLAQNLRLLIIGPLVVGLAAAGTNYRITPPFTAKTTSAQGARDRSGLLHRSDIGLTGIKSALGN